ncbi:hypothetical protein BH11PAT3_BH11PAT3_1330 [soil metagenome]
MPPLRFESSHHDRIEEPLSSAEEIIFEKYKSKYVAASPDAQGLEYSPDHALLVEKRSNEFGDQTERALLFDRIIFNQPAWWGESVQTYRASKYDDYVNGTDLILEFLDENNERLGLLAVDTTVGNEETLAKKQGKIVEKLAHGALGVLEYGPTKDGELGPEYEYAQDVPHVNLILSAPGLELLSKQLAVILSPEAARNHRIQNLFRDEVVQQLIRQRAFIEGLHNISQARKDILTEKMSTIIETIRKAGENKKTPEAEAQVWNDPMANFVIDDKLNAKICPQLKVA